MRDSSTRFLRPIRLLPRRSGMSGVVMQDIGRGLRGCRTETPSTLNGSFSRSALSAQPCQIFAAAAWNRGSSGDFAARIGAVLRARELVEKNHYQQSDLAREDLRLA